MIKAIFLSIILLFSTTGIQVTFTLCGGTLESFSLFEEEILEMSCCNDVEFPTCCDENEIHAIAKPSDMVNGSVLSVEAPVFLKSGEILYPEIRNISDRNINKQTNQRFVGNQSLYLLLQAFRC